VELQRSSNEPSPCCTARTTSSVSQKRHSILLNNVIIHFAFSLDLQAADPKWNAVALLFRPNFGSGKSSRSSKRACLSATDEILAMLVIQEKGIPMSLEHSRCQLR